MREMKVVVLGSGGVGKSALTVRFVRGVFVEQYDPTVEDFYRREIEVDGSPSIIEILDTAGTEQFASMLDLYIRNCQGFLIIYSITSLQSFVDIQSMKDHIERIKCRGNLPMLLVGNKADMDSQREVSETDGRELAQKWGCNFLETSALTSENVNDIFVDIIQQMTTSQISRRRSHRCCII